MVAERSLLQSEGAAFQVYSGDESSETLTPFRNEIENQELCDFLGYDPKRKDGSCVKRTIILISWLAVWVANVVHCLVETKERGKRCQKEYGETNVIIVDTATEQLIRLVKEFAKH